MKKLMMLMVVCGLTSCAATPDSARSVAAPEVLTVHNDGRMEYRDRILPQEDVIIYADGFGGERAAVKVHFPLKNDFFRDSIRVERETEMHTVTQN